MQAGEQQKAGERERRLEKSFRRRLENNPLSSWLSFNNLHVCAEDQVVYHSLSASKPQSVHQDISASQKKAESNQTLILEQTHEGFAAERIPAQPLPAARHTIYRSLHCLHLLQ